MKKPALVIMAREPVPGKVKTRLQPYLSLRQSATLYTAFLQDTTEQVLKVRSCTPFLAFSPLKAKGFFKTFAPGFKLMPQRGRDLGWRMQGIFERLIISGHSPVIIIGSDIPTLPSAILDQALESLKCSDLCFGPTSDGGYYLVGMNKLISGIFDGIPWSTSEVFDITLKNAARTAFSVSLLDEYSDIDTYFGLKQLAVDLENLSTVTFGGIPHFTAQWLKENRSWLK